MSKLPTLRPAAILLSYRQRHSGKFCRLLSSSQKIKSKVANTQQKQNKRAIPNDGLTLVDFVVQSQRIGNSVAPKNKVVVKHAPSFFIKTYGCQMNVNDTDIVRSLLLSAGFKETLDEDLAAIVLTNTCAIRDGAEQKVWQRLQTLRAKRKHHHKQGQQVIGVLGCMAERLKEDLFQQNLVHVIVGPDAYRDLPRLLSAAIAKNQNIYNNHSDMNNNNSVDIDDYNNGDNQHQPESTDEDNLINVHLSLHETYSDITPIRQNINTNNLSAFVSIQRGCSNRCSFCIVPFTRGQERSRPYQSILDEIQKLHDESNIKEVVLLGQNVNSYHDRSATAIEAKPHTQYQISNTGFRNRIRRDIHEGGYYFADLLHDVSEISPELRIRFTSPHPKDYPMELLQLMQERPNICNQLHMPAQSGSTSMLKRMKRGYTREAYLDLIGTVKAMIPSVGLSSDFIAGFCHETHQEHLDTLSLMEQVQFDQAFMFAYSMREKTNAHRTMQDTVPEEIKQKRLRQIIEMFQMQVQIKNETMEVGRLRLVLIEGESKRSIKRRQQGDESEPIMWHGRTDQNKRILFPIDKSDIDNLSCWDGKTLNLWDTSFLSSSSSLLRTSKPSIDELVDHWTHDSTLTGSATTAPLQIGDYGVVQVTEAKGHTLRGKLLWKTTLSEFADWESKILSNILIH